MIFFTKKWSHVYNNNKSSSNICNIRRATAVNSQVLDCIDQQR